MCGTTGQLLVTFTVADQRLVVTHHDEALFAFAVDGADVYAVSSAGLLHLGADGGPDTVLASYGFGFALLVDRDSIYLGQFFKGLLLKHAR